MMSRAAVRLDDDRTDARQAPQLVQGPSGQSPVGGSPEVVVATAAVVVVVVLLRCRGGGCRRDGSDWERSQMSSPLVST